MVDPGTQFEVHGTKKGGLGEQYRIFQAIDMPDIIENVLKCKYAKEANGEPRYDAFVSLNSTDPALIADGLAMLIKMAETAVRLHKIMGTVVSRKMLYQMPGADVLEKARQDYGIAL